MCKSVDCGGDITKEGNDGPDDGCSNPDCRCKGDCTKKSSAFRKNDKGDGSFVKKWEIQGP